MLSGLLHTCPWPGCGRINNISITYLFILFHSSMQLHFDMQCYTYLNFKMSTSLHSIHKLMCMLSFSTSYRYSSNPILL